MAAGNDTSPVALPTLCSDYIIFAGLGSCSFQKPDKSEGKAMKMKQLSIFSTSVDIIDITEHGSHRFN
jgi:hypothetical protein